MNKNLHRSYLVVLLMLFSITVFANKYLPGRSYDPTFVQAGKKLTFQRAGNLLQLTRIVPDTSKHINTIVINLLYPDYTPFKTMTYSVPDTVFINSHEGGIKVVENIEQDKPVYYFVFNCNDGVDFTIGNKAIVVREDGVKTGAGYCSWMGFMLKNLDGTNKLIADRQWVDTIHYSNENGYGWYTYQFGTTYVYDIKTGNLEHSFPRGTTVASVEKVQGSWVYFTTNDYFMRSNDIYDSWGRAQNPTSITQYNADFSVRSTVQVPTASFTEPGFYPYSATICQPLIAGNTIYYLHQITYKNDNYDFKSKSYLTSEAGTILTTTNKFVYNKWHLDTEDLVGVRYLGPTVQYAIVDNQYVYSLPQLDSIGSFSSYTTGNNGAIKFVQFQSPQVKIFNNDFSLYKTVQIPDSLTNYSTASASEYVNDDKLELVFKSDNGLVVYNEDGAVLVDQTFSPLSGGMFGYGAPIVFNLPGEKFGRISGTDGSQYHRTAPVSVHILNEQNASGKVRIYQKLGNELKVFADTLISNGTAPFDLPEGTFYARSLQTEGFMSTYAPHALDWNQLDPFIFHTERDSFMEIARKPAPAALNLNDVGSISGAIKFQGTLIAPKPDPIEVYVYDANAKKIVAVLTNVDSTFAFQHLPAASYDVYVTIPGYDFGQTTVQLMNGVTSVSNVDFTAEVATRHLTSDFVSGLSPVGQNKGLYPNPAVKEVRWLDAASDARVDVLDLSGKLLQTKRQTNGMLDVSDLKAGMYFLRTERNNKRLFVKLIKL